jgi:phosphoribosylanthranilate isomerase
MTGQSAVPFEIKICGLGSIDALDAALEAGADFVGLVFFPPSPRNIPLPQAAALARRARGRAQVVALTVDATLDALRAIRDAVAPDVIQLHGREPPALLAALREETPVALWKAIPVATAGDLAAAAAYRGVADRLLFDAKPPPGATRPGGNARAFDWAILAALDPAEPFVLSGGLDPANVAAALRATRAAAVDVSSGVETAPGVKSPEKIRAFVRAARAAAAAEEFAKP